MEKIIYIPMLHSSLAPAGLPKDVLFVNPGLNSKDGAGQRFFEPDNLPWRNHEAKAILAELLSLGLSFGQNGDLRFLSGQSRLKREEARRAAADKDNLRAENLALQEFTASGRAPHGKHGQGTEAAQKSSDSQTERLREAQKALLLAWEHEECILGMRELEDKVREGQNRLLEALGDGPAAADFPLAAPDFPEEARPELSQPSAAAPDASLPSASPEYSWRLVLEALSAFLPADARLFTAFGPMIEELRLNGLLQPLPAKALHGLENWPEALRSSLLVAKLPLWRLLGYAALPPDRPWLVASHELLAAPRLEHS